MIITIFVILLIISLALITIAKALKQPPLALAGFLFLFILGLVLMIGGLEYQAGETEAYTYVCACCNETRYTEECSSGELTLKNITKQKVYSAYDSEIVQGIQVNHIYGFFLCIIAIFGFVLTLTNLEAFEQKDAYEQYRRGQP